MYVCVCVRVPLQCFLSMTSWAYEPVRNPKRLFVLAVGVLLRIQVH